MAAVGLLVAGCQMMGLDPGFSAQTLGVLNAASFAAGLAVRTVAKSLGHITDGRKLNAGFVAGFGLSAMALLSVKAIDMMQQDKPDVSGITAAAIGATVSGVIGAFGLAVMLGAGTVTAATVAGVTAIGVVAVLTIASVVINNGRKGRLNVPEYFGQLMVAKKELKSYVESKMDINVGATVNLVNTTINNLDEAKQTVNKEITELETNLNKIHIGFEVKETSASLMDQIFGEVDDEGKRAGGLIQSMHDEMGRLKSVIELGVTLVPPTDSEGNKLNGKQLFETIGLANDVINEEIKNIGEELSKLLTKGMKQGLSDEESGMVESMVNFLRDIQNATEQGTVIGKAKTGYLLKMNGLGDLNEESFKEAIQVYKELEEELTTGLTEASKSAFEGMVTYQAIMEERIKAYVAANKEVPKELSDAYADVTALIEDWDPTASVSAKVAESTAEIRKEYLETAKEAYKDYMPGMNDLLNDNSYYMSIQNWALNRDFDPEHTAEMIETQLFGTAMRKAFGNENMNIITAMLDATHQTMWDFFNTDLKRTVFDGLASALGGSDTITYLTQLGYDITGYIKSGIATGDYEIIQNAAGQMVLKFKDGTEHELDTTKPGILQMMKDLGIEMGDAVTEGTAEATTGQGLFGQLLQMGGNGLSGLFQDLFGGVAKKGEEAKGFLQHVWQDLPNWMGDNVTKPVVRDAQRTGNKVQLVANDTGNIIAVAISDGVKTADKATEDATDSIEGQWNAMVPVVTNDGTLISIGLRDNFVQISQDAADAMGDVGESFGTLPGAAEITGTETKTVWQRLMDDVAGIFAKGEGQATNPWKGTPKWFEHNVTDGIRRTFQTANFEGMGKYTVEELQKGITGSAPIEVIEYVFLSLQSFKTVEEFIETVRGNKETTQYIDLEKYGEWKDVADWIHLSFSDPVYAQKVGLDLDKWKSVSAWIEDLIAKDPAHVKEKIGLEPDDWTSVKAWVETLLADKSGKKIVDVPVDLVQKWTGTVIDWASKLTGTNYVQAGVTLAQKWAGSVIDWATKLVGDGSVKVPVSLKKDPNSKKVSFEIGGKVLSNGDIQEVYLQASGGFPKTGQMFIAREAGPELVGTIGNKTAVANNDQIVAGVASGVAAGQGEQNALLRKIDERLRRLESKEFIAQVGEPSTAWGRFNRASEELRARTEG